MEQIAVKKFLDTLEELPSLPIVVRQVWKVINSHNSSMGQISTIIAKDQALAAKTVRLVNSAYYGMREPVSSIKKAIIILGLNTVCNLMTGLSIIKLFNDKKQTFDYTNFWKDSLLSAVLAEQIAKIEKPDIADDCFMAALIHDVGTLVFDQFFHDDYYTIFNKSKGNLIHILHNEKNSFGVTHCNAGGLLCNNWNMPEIITLAVDNHHINPQRITLENPRYETVVKIVILSDMLVQLKDSPDSVKKLRMSMFGLKLSNENLTKIISKSVSDVSNLSREWGL